MSLSPRHERDARPIPARPYRDSALLHGGLAIVIVVGSALTGSPVGRSAVIALAYFIGATGWSWWRFRERIRARDAHDARAHEGGDS